MIHSHLFTIVNTTLAPTSIARLVKTCWFSLFGVTLLLTAWVSDDAYMTFRTIDNFVHGYGLRWNAAERVQAYTHPLWMSLVAVFYWWTGEPYFTSIALSIALTLLAVWLLIRLAPSIWSAGAGLTILWCSRAFVDYSTSGLENPLTNVLLLLFVGCYLSPRRRFFAPALLAALIMLNRLDVGLLVLPALVVLLPRRVSWRDWAAVAAGFLPLLIWELFSVFYYGVPFPNTAYAKLKTGVPESELLQQGFIYLLDSVRHDPVTLLATAAVTSWAMVDNPRGTRPIAIGIVCYVAYVTYVGGDFMSGRMFVAPLLAAVAILVVAERPIVRELQWALVPLALVLGFNASRAFVQPGDPREALRGSGIADERLWYFAYTGLVNYTRGRPWPSHPWAEQGRRARQEGSRVIVNCCNGMLGYFSGPQAYIVDTLALGDPLLARLPAEKDWRIGHFSRKIPQGLSRNRPDRFQPAGGSASGDLLRSAVARHARRVVGTPAPGRGSQVQHGSVRRSAGASVRRARTVRVHADDHVAEHARIWRRRDRDRDREHASGMSVGGEHAGSVADVERRHVRREPGLDSAHGRAKQNDRTADGHDRDHVFRRQRDTHGCSGGAPALPLRAHTLSRRPRPRPAVRPSSS